MKTVHLALVVAAAIGALVPAARASVLCRTPTRAVVERTACRARETTIPLVDVGPGGLPGPPGPAGARGRGIASVFDAAGTLVGPVFWVRDYAESPYGPAGPSAHALIDHAAVGGTAAFGVTRNGLGAGTVYYTDAACSGTPYIVGVQLLPELQIVRDTVFFPVTPAPRVDLRSYEVADVPGASSCTTTTRGGCCLAIQLSVAAGALAAAGHTTLDALGFHAPFSAHVE